MRAWRWQIRNDDVRMGKEGERWKRFIVYSSELKM